MVMPAHGELLLDVLATRVELVGDHDLGQRDLDLLQQCLEDGVARGSRLLEALAATEALAHVGDQLLGGVELGGELGELVVESGSSCSWIALYTRGNSYLYWPKIFGRAPLGVADLEEAVALARQDPAPKRVYVRAWIALGDGYWKTDRPERAKATWQEGLRLFPDDPQLAARLARDGDELERYLYDQLDPNKRVDTDLTPLWEGE